MDVQVAETGPCSRTVTIRIPPERIRDHIDRAFSQASRQIRMKGFRPGKIPRPVLEKKFGDDIRNQARDQIVNESFRDACRDHNIKVVGQPRVEGLGPETPVDGAQSIEFTVHVDVHPEVKLCEVEGIAVDTLPTEATEADVDKALEQLADQKKTLNAVEEPCGDTDFVRADLEYFDAAGNPVHRRADSQLNPTIPIAGCDPAAFKATLVGQQKGGEFAMPIEFSPHFEVEAVRGQKGQVKGKILEVQRVQRAPIDDALAKEFGFEELAKLRTELLRQIGERKVHGEQLRQEEMILKHIVENSPFELPPSLVEQQMKADIEAYRERLKQQNRSEEEIATAVENAQTEAREGAERRIRMVFLLEAIAQAKQVRVEESDMMREIEMVAQQNGVSVEQVIKHFRENNMFNDLSMGILERKVREFLRDKAKITDKGSTSA